MPLLYKARDPNYGVRKVRKRNVVRRKGISAFILPETMQYIASQKETMSPGQLVDAAVKLYANHRELSTVSTKQKGIIKLQPLQTTVSVETIAYLHFIRDAMTPGELIDAAIMLYRKMAQENR